jgi:aminoglycoside phosphotransferase (APT) family kinase protein
MPVWDAEVVIDVDLVRGLLAEQFPELDAGSARPLAEGWDNAVWVVEERWAFRFPRREVAIPGVERELALLARLAPLVPVPIPVPEFVGRPDVHYPWPFFGCALLRGHEPADVSLSGEERIELAGELGRLLRALHAPETRLAADPQGSLPVDPNRRTRIERVVLVREQLRELEAAGMWRARPAVEAVLAEASGLPPPVEPYVLAHGDLHARHVLVDGGALSGVIDWGDVCVADPSVDLMLVWSLLPPAGRDRFVAAYGPVDEARRLRARVLAFSLGAALALYARDTGNPPLEREALAGLERTLVDWA